MAAVTRPTQGLLLAFLGCVLTRLAYTDGYLSFVAEWMKWPVLVSGVVVLGLGLGLVLFDRGHDAHAHKVPTVTWLLALPGLVTFTVSPPELGSYLAERRSGESRVVSQPGSLAELNPDQVIPVDVTEFIWRAQDGGATLQDQPVSLTGFVSYGESDNWYVTRLSIGCCAADAVAYQVQVAEADRPPRDQWVTVTGTYVPESGTDGRTPPALVAADVVEREAPRQTYE